MSIVVGTRGEDTGRDYRTLPSGGWRAVRACLARRGAGFGFAPLQARPRGGGLGADLVVVMCGRDEAEILVGLLPAQDGDRLDDLPHLAPVPQRARLRQL